MDKQRSQVLVALLAGWVLAASLLFGLILARSAHGSAEPDVDADLAAAIALYRTEGAEAALPEFLRLLADYRATGNAVAEMQALRYVGECHWRLGDFDSSREYLDQAMVRARELGNQPAMGRILNVRGLLDWDQGDYAQALENFAAAHNIALELDDRRLAASTLNNRGLVRDELGDYRVSMADYERALALFSEQGDRRGQGDALGNIGGVYLLLGRYDQALRTYREALAISEALQSKSAMTIDHGNIALALLGLGRVSEALRHFDRALELAREAGMSQEAAYWLRGRANARISQGKYDLGLDDYRTALAVYDESGARGLLLDAQYDMGMLMLTLGDHVSAETWFQQAIRLAREIGHQQALTRNLLALGDLHLRHGRMEEARALYAQANRRAGEAGEVANQAESLLRLARVDVAQQQYPAAAKSAADALALAQDIEATPLEAEAWYALGEAGLGQFDPESALHALGQALRAAGQDGDPDLLWRVHYVRAQVLEHERELRLAVAALEAAVRVIEGVRERLREERFRSGWVHDKYQVYLDLVRLQLELGRTQDAFSTAERLRARNFLAQLERGMPAAGDGAEESHATALRERVRQLQRALAEEQERGIPDRRDMAIATFSTELMRAERDYQAFLDDRINASPRLQGIRVPELDQIQGRLAPDEALLEYVAGEGGLMIFLLRRDRLVAVTSAVGLAELTARVNLVRELIRRPDDTSWRKPAAALSEHLIRPLQQRDLLRDVSHLHVVPHGMLNYLPFALLPLAESGEPALIERFSLSYLPAAAALATAAEMHQADRSMLALAPAAARLQFAPREAESVASLFRPHARLLLGKAATETAFKSEAPDYRFLHVATHGVFNLRNPLLSGLELEADTLNDGLLEVHEILGLSLQAELVTMSACQTGLGSGWFSDLPPGDDFVGLTRAFLVAGSDSVLASLWEVDDRSTVTLMQGFYGGMGGRVGANDRAEALARVQRVLRASKEFNHPFYWAPFVLVGQHGTAAARS